MKRFTLTQLVLDAIAGGWLYLVTYATLSFLMRQP